MYYKKKLVALLILTAITGVAYAAEITDVMVRQRWPWSRKVDIEYVLKCTTGGEYDIKIKAYNGEVPLPLPMESLSGDICGVKDGTWRIVWDPTLTTYTDQGSLSNFRVELTLNPVPLYMVVDLTKTPGEQGQVEYIYEYDLTNGNGNWGTWERNPVTNVGSVIESVIWTGVTNDNVYRTEKVVLRRIKRGSFVMGEGTGALDVTLTRDFYIGVFQITQQQWYDLMGNERSAYFTDPESKAFRPMERVAYTDIRGGSLGTNWPGVDGKGGYRVDDDSFMKKLRDKTCIEDFDLPTDAQWEYACRARTTTYYNDGNLAAPTDGVSKSPATSNRFFDVLGRYAYNGGKYWDAGTGAWKDATQGFGPTNGTAIVGSYLPNAWGVYDMSGNVFEWCLDWNGALTGGMDPVGAASDSTRIVRGGCWSYLASYGSSAYRLGRNPATYRDSSTGFRLVIHLP